MNEVIIRGVSKEIQEAGKLRRDIAISRLRLISNFKKREGNFNALVREYEKQVAIEGNFIISLERGVDKVIDEVYEAKKNIPNDVEFSRRWKLKRFFNKIRNVMKAYKKQIKLYSNGLKKEREVLIETWKTQWISEAFLDQTYMAFLKEMKGDEELLRKLIRVRKYATKLDEAEIFLRMLDMFEFFLTYYLHAFEQATEKSIKIADKSFHPVERCAKRLSKLAKRVA